MRKALAMGATRGVLVTDPAIEGSDTVATARVLAAALGTLEYDLVFAGVDTSDGVSGIVAPAVAALIGLPYLSYAATIDPDPATRTVRVNRITADGYDVLQAPMPALISGTQALGEPRYPSLKGIMAAKAKPVATVPAADAPSHLTVLRLEPPPKRAGGKIVGKGPEAVPELLRLLREEARLL